MEKHYHRRPVGNFFILPSLQFGLIKKIVAPVLLSTFVCIGSMLLLYWITYRSVAFYRVILDASMDISSRENIIFILLPSLAIAAVVNVVIGFFIGMYASRKYAVPIYKLEQWIGFLNEEMVTYRVHGANFWLGKSVAERVDATMEVVRFLAKNVDHRYRQAWNDSLMPQRRSFVHRIRELMDRIYQKCEVMGR